MENLYGRFLNCEKFFIKDTIFEEKILILYFVQNFQQIRKIVFSEDLILPDDLVCLFVGL